MNRCVAGRQVVPEHLIGPLAESSSLLCDGPALGARLAEDGYLFLRGVFLREDVLAAREAVLSRLVKVGEIHEPAVEGVFTGQSRRREVAGDLGSFWHSVSETWALRRLSHGAQLAAVMNKVFGEPARPHDYIFLRVGPVGRSTELHFDRPFFARGSERIHTVWIAIGDVPVTDGPLIVVEGSQRYHDLISTVKETDYNSKASPRVALHEDPVTFAQQRRTRLLTADFAAGDMVIFGMTTLHGSLDNCSPTGRVRVSCDVRWQPLADPADPRYCGPNPGGTTGAGYGELNGAKPLTEPWHTR